MNETGAQVTYEEMSNGGIFNNALSTVFSFRFGFFKFFEQRSISAFFSALSLLFDTIFVTVRECKFDEVSERLLKGLIHGK